MGEKTSISWAHHTFNPWMGCTKVSPACAHCYAERDMDHRYRKVKWGPKGTRVKTSEANWKLPLKWNRDAEKTYLDACERYDLSMQPRAKFCRKRVFCASLADVFEDWDGEVTLSANDQTMCCPKCGHGAGMPIIQRQLGPPKDQCSKCGATMIEPTLDGLRAMLFKLIDSTPWLDWLLLTKRPENIRHMWPRCTRCRGNGRIEMLEHCPRCKGHGMSPLRSNVWLGATVENQREANKRIPDLLAQANLAATLFLSCEPLLEEINLQEIMRSDGWAIDALEGIYSRHHDQGIDHPAAIESHGGGPRVGWVITGSETGQADQVRITDPAWVRSLRDQCVAAGVPFHYKQDAVNGKAIDTPELDGRRWVEFPEVAA